MKAQKMFEKLGWKLGDIPFGLSECGFSYFKDNKYSIFFDKTQEVVSCTELNIKEIEAVKKQMEELEWENNEI